MIILTSPRSDHLSGLQDVISRYQVGTILDAGMLHPSAAYASWQRTIREKNLNYHLAVQGQTLPLGKEALIQIVWPPSVMHTGSNNIRDNSLIFRLITPGLRFLFLGATAQSDYALSGLQTQVMESAQQADIVQIVYGAGQPITNDLKATLKETHASLLVVTPPSTRSTKTSLSIPPNAIQTTFAAILPNMRIMPTVQMGDIDIVSDGLTWQANTS
jgi:competence protein ComEC